MHFQIFFFALLSVFVVEADVVRRAVFDFGSGAIRLHVADVDVEREEIIETIYTEWVRIPLMGELLKSVDGRFSDEIQGRALAAAIRLKGKAIELGAEEIYGIATEAYRRALNGEALIERYRNEGAIPIVVITNEEEGMLSFLSLAKEKHVDPKRVVCCDIGSGSFQITYLDQNEKIQVYSGSFGGTSTKNALLEYFGKVETLNPMTLDEWEVGLAFLRSVIPPIPSQLVEKLQEPCIQFFGVGGHAPELTLLDFYGVEELLAWRERYLNKVDSEIVSNISYFKPAGAVSDLLLATVLMERLGANGFLFFEPRGSSNSAALLIYTERDSKI